MNISRTSFFCGLAVLLNCLILGQNGWGQQVGSVEQDELLAAQDNNANWLMYGHTYNSQRYSSLEQIDRENVGKLIPIWSFQTGVLDGFECTPLVIDGIMYITTPWNHAYAIDCLTGSQLWHYQKSLPDNLAPVVASPVK